MYRVDDFFQKYAHSLGLELLGSEEGLSRPILVPEAHRPGLALAGFMKSHAGKRILVFGKVEMEYLRHLSSDLRLKRLEELVQTQTPALILTRRYRPLPELLAMCNKFHVPLLRTKMSTMNLLSKLTMLLTEEFSPSISLHGTLVEVFGIGVLIQGNSSVGKSETALGLVERGHRLVSDDIVKVKKREGIYLEGFGAELTRYHMEIRGIGIINVAHLYGAVCVRESKSIDIVVKLETWDETYFYDRVGLEEKYIDLLGIKLPYHLLPVKPGRDVVLLLETIALNQRLKGMGYHSAKEFNNKVVELTTMKKPRKLKSLADELI